MANIYTKMTVLRRLFFIILLTFLTTNSFSQSLVGTQSNYAGSRSLSMNPALMSTSNLYSDFSVASLGLTFSNDFLYINGADLSKFFFTEEHPAPEYIIDDSYKSNFMIYDNPNFKPNNVYESLDLSLLSFMYSIDSKQTVGFSLNGRVYTSGTNIPHDVPQLCVFGLEEESLHGRYQSSGAEISTMEWAELAFSYSRKVYDRYLNRMDAGVSAKYLLGYSAAAANINNLDYEIFSEDSVVVNNFDSEMAYSLPLNYNESFTSKSLFDKSLVRGNGLSFDIGISFTRKKNIVYNQPRLISSCMMPKVDYRWRLSASLMDVGFINFNKNALTHEFVNDGSVNFDKTIFDNVESFNDMVGFLSEIYYNGDPSASVVGDKFKMGLPTTFRLQFDYNIVEHFYVNTTFIQPISLLKYSVKAAPQLLVEPRFESDYFDFSIPLTLRDYQHFMVGASARIGFVTIGTQNLASYLGFGNVNGMDLYVSVKFNFAKGSCDVNKFDACWSADYGHYKNRKRQ